MRRVATLLVALVPLLSAAGQGVLIGSVSSPDGSPLEYVSVGVKGTTTGCVTDSKGQYRLAIEGSDSATIRYSSTGYEPQERRVGLVGLAVVRIDVVLKPQPRQLQAVEIKDEKTRNSQFTNIGVQKLDAAVGPSSGVESLLKTLPDVGSNNELSSQYSVRGGSFDENLVYINGVEIFRPMLIRSGQQEGMSIINPDLVDYILFSPGGFGATYGDRMSSVLDITYSRPVGFKGSASASLLGASAALQGTVGQRWTYAAAARLHSNRYLMRSLDTKGSYSNRYADLQATVGYKASDALSLNLLTICTDNTYGLVPKSQTTAFNQRSMELDIYFDGAEEDKYNTLLAALTADYRPNDDWHLQASLSMQRILESERYDIQSQYWLYQLGIGQQVGQVERLDRGVGTFLEHARNRLRTGIYTLNLKATIHAPLGSWHLGLTAQANTALDRLREWRLVDSAGYALPATQGTVADSSALPQPPLLQHFVNANSSLSAAKTIAFAQREINLASTNGTTFKLLAGIRAGLFGAKLDYYGRTANNPLQPLLSPRLSLSIKPPAATDILFRLAAGIYQQPPLYREYRLDDGSLLPGLHPQTSYQAMATADWNFSLWDKPFKFTADIYYKYITNLIPYTIDNLRISYHPDLQAVAYAAGLSLRLNGTLAHDLESWASLSLMHTQEDIEGDSLRWLDRPADQRLSFKLLLQDYIPRIPWWRMGLTLVYATGTPIIAPYGRQDPPLRLPTYFRVDWGNTIHFAKIPKIAASALFRRIDDIQVGIELFNLFDRLNTTSYIWVTDYDNHPYRVPNYLTARQVNFKLTVLW